MVCNHANKQILQNSEQVQSAPIQIEWIVAFHDFNL